MQAPLNVTVRCSDCSATLGVFYRVPQDNATAGRLQVVARTLLDWHRATRKDDCAGSGTTTQVGIPRESAPGR